MNTTESASINSQENIIFQTQNISAAETAEFPGEASLFVYLKAPLGILLIMIIVTAAIGNVIVCYIVYRKPAMQSAINLLLANMALSDVAVATLCMPFSLATLVSDNWAFGSCSCQLLVFLQESFISASIWTMQTISIDRYLIIVHRKDKLTSTHAKRYIALIWCSAFAVACPPLLGYGKYKFSVGYTQCYIGNDRSLLEFSYMLLKLSLTYFIPIVSMTFSYICILLKTQKNTLRIEAKPEYNFAVTYQSGKLGLPIVPRSRNDVTLKSRSFKTVLTLFIVIFVCWTPYYIYVLARDEHESGQNIIYTLLLFVGFSKVVINPIVYFIRIEKFKDACKDLIPRVPKLTNPLKFLARRRINPSSIYECKDDHDTRA